MSFLSLARPSPAISGFQPIETILSCNPHLSIRSRTASGLAILALVIFTLAGCATDPIMESGPYPRVADCALIHQATPPLYVCDGKTYTANQLDAIRHGVQPPP
jgi:hypothetical protein